MPKSKKWALLAGFMLVSLILAACQPQQVEVPVTVVVEQTKEVQVVQTVEVAQPTAAPPSRTPPRTPSSATCASARASPSARTRPT